MFRLINIEHMYNFDIDLNWIPYRFRYRSQSYDRRIVPVFGNVAYSNNYHHQTHGVNGGIYKQKREQSPTYLQNSQNAIDKYITSHQKGSVNLKKKRKEGEVDAIKPLRYKNKQVQQNSSALTTPKRINTEEQVDEPFSYFSEPLSHFSAQIPTHEDEQSTNKVDYKLRQKRQTIRTQQVEPFQVQDYYREELFIAESNILSQKERSEYKLEQTTKSHLRSELSHEEQRYTKSQQSQSFNYLKHEKIGEIDEGFQSIRQLQSEQPQKIENNIEQLQYSQRKSKKVQKSLIKIMAKNDSSKEVKKAAANIIETTRTPQIKNEQQEQSVMFNCQVLKLKKEVGQFNSNNHECFGDLKWQRQRQKNRYYVDPTVVNCEGLEDIELYIPEDNQQSQRDSYIQYDICSSHPKSDHSSNSQRDSQLDQIELNKEDEEENQKNQQDFNCLKGNQSQQSEKSQTYRISKIHELANLVSEQHEDHPSRIEHESSDKQDSYDPIPQLFTTELAPQFHQRLFAHKEKEEHYRGKRGYFDESQKGAYGRQYLIKRQQKIEKNQNKPVRRATNSKKVEKSVSNQNELKQKRQQQQSKHSEKDHPTPQTGKDKSRQIPHIWSFSDLMSEEDLKGVNKNSDSDALAFKASPNELSSIHADENTNHFFKDVQKISQSFPNYHHQSHQMAHYDQNETPLGAISEQNSMEIRNQVLKLKTVEKSLEGEHILNLFGQHSNMRQLSYLTIEPKEESEWKGDLSKFMVQNNIPSQDHNSLLDNEDEQLFSSSHYHHNEDQNSSPFNLEAALKEDNKPKIQHSDEKQRSNQKEMFSGLHFVANQKQQSKQKGENEEKQKEEEFVLKEGDQIDNLSIKMITAEVEENIPSMRSSKFQLTVKNIMDYRHHFHPRKEAMKRFTYSHSKPFDSKTRSPQQNQNNSESFSPCKRIEMQLSSLSRQKSRLKKNLTRFKTRIFDY